MRYSSPLNCSKLWATWPLLSYNIVVTYNIATTEQMQNLPLGYENYNCLEDVFP